MLQFHSGQGRVIPWHVEVSRQHTALVRMARHKVKVESLLVTVRIDESFVDDAARRRVHWTTIMVLHEEPLRDSLVHHDNSDLRLRLTRWVNLFNRPL